MSLQGGLFFIAEHIKNMFYDQLQQCKQDKKTDVKICLPKLSVYKAVHHFLDIIDIENIEYASYKAEEAQSCKAFFLHVGNAKNRTDSFHMRHTLSGTPYPAILFFLFSIF